MSSSVPPTMKAIVIEQTGGPEVLQLRTDQPVPVPRDGELLVHNHLAGVNYIDTYFRTGLYPSPKPEILGREAIGTVVAVGGSSASASAPASSSSPSFQPGDRVVWMHTGSYAEYTAVPAAKTAKVPADLPDETVIGSFLSGLTVLSLARETYDVQRGDWVLLHAAAGGAGYLMTQVLKAKGAKVLATAGGPEKCAIVRALGADVVVDYRSSDAAARDWVAVAKEVTGGQGVDVVFDSVGKDTWEGSLEAVKRKGTIVWFGNASGPVPLFPLTYVVFYFILFFFLAVLPTLARSDADTSKVNCRLKTSRSPVRSCLPTSIPARSSISTSTSCSRCCRPTSSRSRSTMSIRWRKSPRLTRCVYSVLAMFSITLASFEVLTRLIGPRGPQDNRKAPAAPVDAVYLIHVSYQTTPPAAMNTSIALRFSLIKSCRRLTGPPSCVPYAVPCSDSLLMHAACVCICICTRVLVNVHITILVGFLV